MKRTIALLILTAAAPLLSAQDITGDWRGTLNTGMGELRLVLHIKKTAEHTFSATLDSVDQGASGIPVKSVSLNGPKLKLDLPAIQGTYEGTIAGGNTISGTWSQGTPMPLEFKRAAVPIKADQKPARPSDIDSAWTGTLDTPAGELHLIFHIKNTTDGLIATIDSPDQKALGIPTSSVTRGGASLRIEAKGIGGVFEGAISGDLTTIDGNWSQGGGTTPLTLKRAKD